MQHQLTHSQLKQVFEDLTGSTVTSLTLDIFRRVCERNREILIPSNYTDEDFSIWIEEQFSIIHQRCNKAEQQRGLSRGRQLEKRGSSYHPSGQKKKNQPRQLKDSRSPDHSLDSIRNKQPERPQISSGRPSRFALNSNSSVAAADGAAADASESSLGGTTPAQVICFEAFAKNYLCTVTLRNIVYTIDEEIRMRRSQEFKAKHDSTQRKKKLAVEADNQVHLKEELKCSIGPSPSQVETMEKQLSTVREHRYIVGAHTSRRPETAQRGNESYTTRSQNLRYRVADLFYETADELLMSEEDQKSILHTVQTKNQEEYEDQPQSDQQRLEVRSPQSSSGCTVQIGSRTSEQTNQIAFMGTFLPIMEAHSPSVASHAAANEAATGRHEIDHFGPLDLKGAQSMLAAAVRAKGTLSDGSTKDRQELKIDEIHVSLESKKQVTLESKSARPGLALPEDEISPRLTTRANPMSFAPDTLAKVEQSSSVSAGDVSLVPSNLGALPKIAETLPKHSPMEGQHESQLVDVRDEPKEDMKRKVKRKQMKEVKKIGKGSCGCSGGCQIF